MLTSLFTRDHLKVLLLPAISALVGTILVVVHELVVAQKLGFMPTSIDDGAVLFVLGEALDDLGIAFLTASVLALFYEFAVKRLEIQELTKLFRSAQTPDGVAEIAASRQAFDDRLSADIADLRSGDCLDLVGTSQRVTFAEKPGFKTIASNVTDGVHFRILLLHPESKLLTCIETLSADFGFPDVRSSLAETARGSIRQIVRLVPADGSCKGSIEIRFHKDLYSTLSYHSTSKLTALGLYFSHENGRNCPMLILDDGEIRSESQKHFLTLWDRCSAEVLIRLDGTNQSNADNIDAYFPSA